MDTLRPAYYRIFRNREAFVAHSVSKFLTRAKEEENTRMVDIPSGNYFVASSFVAYENTKQFWKEVRFTAPSKRDIRLAKHKCEKCKHELPGRQFGPLGKSKRNKAGRNRPCMNCIEKQKLRKNDHLCEDHTAKERNSGKLAELKTRLPSPMTQELPRQFRSCEASLRSNYHTLKSSTTWARLISRHATGTMPEAIEGFCSSFWSYKGDILRFPTKVPFLRELERSLQDVCATSEYPVHDHIFQFRSI